MKKMLAFLFAFIIISGCIFDHKDNGKKTGSELTYTVSGTLKYKYTNVDNTDADLSIFLSISGVGLSISGNAIKVQETTTDKNGEFSFTGIPNGQYTIQLTTQGYSFGTDLQKATVKDANLSGLVYELTSINSNYLSPKISGSIKDSLGAVIKGVLLTIYSAALKNGKYAYSNINDKTEVYNIDLSSGGTYGFVPSKKGYIFKPSNLTVTVSNGDSITGIDFMGYPKASGTGYKISGSTLDYKGNKIAGITVTLSGSETDTKTFITGTSGTFEFQNLSAGSYTIVPSKNNYTFNPSSKTITISSKDITGQDFIVSFTNYSIFGTLKNSYGVGIMGILVKLSGTEIKSSNFISGTDGSYKFTNLNEGSFNIMPFSDSYTFDPVSKNVTLTVQDESNIDFIGTGDSSGYFISGYINNESGIPVPGVTVEISANDNIYRSTQTLSDGSYYIGNLENNILYKVAPKMDNFSFYPNDSNVSVLGRSQSRVDFTCFIYFNEFNRISGSIISINGEGVPGVKINAYISDTLKKIYTTGTGGIYIFENLGKNIYTIIPKKEGYIFSPSSRSVDCTNSNTATLTANFNAYETGTIPDFSVSGRIIDNNGNGASGVGIYVSSTSEDKINGTSDSNGYFNINDIPVLSNNINLKIDGSITTDLYYLSNSKYLFKTDSYTLKPITTTDINIPCSLNYCFSWKVINSDGDILPYYTTTLTLENGNKKTIQVNSNENTYICKNIYEGKTSICFSRFGYSFEPDSLMYNIGGTETAIILPDITAKKLCYNEYFPLKTGLTRTYSKLVRDNSTKQTTESTYTEIITGSETYNGKTYWMTKNESGDTLSVSRAEGEYIYEYSGFGILQNTLPYLKETCEQAGGDIYGLFLKKTGEISAYYFNKNISNYEILNESIEKEGTLYDLTLSIKSCRTGMIINVPAGTFSDCIIIFLNITLKKTSTYVTSTFTCEPNLSFAKGVGLIKSTGSIYEGNISRTIFTDKLTGYNIP